MKTLCWSCRGLRNPWEVKAFRNLLSIEGPNIVLLMETAGKKSVEMNVIKGITGPINRFGVDCSGFGKKRAGGLMVLWNNSVEIDYKVGP